MSIVGFISSIGVAATQPIVDYVTATRDVRRKNYTAYLIGVARYERVRLWNDRLVPINKKYILGGLVK